MFRRMMKGLCLLLATLAAFGALFSGLAEALPEVPAPEEPAPLRTARIRAVGDLMAHKRQLAMARQRDGTYDFHPQYALVTDALSNADYTIANLETTIGQYKNMPYSGFPMFNTPEAMLDAVKDAGVDFLTLANNHMLDRYLGGLYNTIDQVEARGFDFGGGNRSPEERDTPVIVEVNGIRIGMLCYTQMTNGMEHSCGRDARDFAVNYLKKERFAQDVQRLKDAGAEAIIAMTHWGQEYHRKPDAGTVALARALVAVGVDVVLGSHPHVVQPVEYVTVTTEDGATRTGLVAYSLGNFISGMVHAYTDAGIILDFTLRERQDGGFEAVNVCAVPVYTSRQGGGIRALPSLKYYAERPKGMDKSTYGRMKYSVRSLYEVLGDAVPMIAE